MSRASATRYCEAPRLAWQHGRRWITRNNSCVAKPIRRESLMRKTPTPPRTSEAAIFARIWSESSAGLTPALARRILKLRFSAEDEARMRELARRNQLGELTDAEQGQLDGFVKVGDLLAIMHSRARRVLKQAVTMTTYP